MITKHRFRYVILMVGCLCLTSISSNVFTFSIAQVCMASTSNTTHHAFFHSVDYTPAEISLVNWAVSLGTILATVPFTEAYNRYGAKWPFFFAGIMSSIVTLLMPFGAQFSLLSMVVLRFVQGVSYAADFAAVGILCSNWATLKQNGLFISVLTVYTPLSSAITDSIGGILCMSSYGWPMVYFSHAVFGIIIFMFWICLYEDQPQTSKHVSKVELERIQRDKSAAQINGCPDGIPYRAILTDIVIWAVWINAFTDIFSANFLSTYSPYYYRNALKYSIMKTGNFSAIARLSNIPFRLLYGWLSDTITIISEDAKLRLFNTIAVFGAGLLFVGVVFVPEELPIIVVALFAAVNMVLGAGCGGFYKCGVMHARQYSHFVLAACQFVKCIALFVGPALVFIFVEDETSNEQWKRIFLVIGISLLISNVIFWKFATSKPAAYTIEPAVEDLPQTVMMTGKNSVTLSISSK
ncbi:MFS domain-containing protein [Aphelenchoides besseyi]|nr:MFS domain-containing protein [Aphelenchoides besseyi]